MTRQTTRARLISGAFVSASFAIGALGCGTTSNATEEATDAGAVCIAQRGEHCGGNIRNACSCAAGLACMAKPVQTGSLVAPPTGDVGGTCEPIEEETDRGGCVSSQGGPCGGNSRFPCSCADGLACTSVQVVPGASIPPPSGDVVDTCQPLDTCISSEGGPCGGNTRIPCSCAAGLVCTSARGKGALVPPPTGDVGGTCQSAAR